MNVLVDTEILLWFQEDNPKLTPANKSILENIANTVWVSQISLIEVAIKLKIGKLPDFFVDTVSIAEQTVADGFLVKSLQNEHIVAYDRVTLFEDHRDHGPSLRFDRLILATALHEGWPVMSADRKFSWYKDQIEVIW